jgi:hypothetical protein
MNKHSYKKTNGRVNILTCNPPDVTEKFQMYDKIPVNQCATFRNPTEGLWNNTTLSQIFFSGKNICNLQNAIRIGVYNKSNGKFVISNQDEDTLQIIMRSIFLQHAMNQPNNIKQQVEQLNKIVLDYCIPQVYGEAKGYKKYLEDVSTMYTPIAPPVLANNTDKELILRSWF